MKIGSTDIVDCKIGTTQVNKIYLGSNLVWEKAGATLLLDLYPNAAAAYSLRKLRTAYAGSAIRVRRSSDSTELNIGFVDNELDTVSLLSFVGANDGFVTTWYDQSGEGNDVSQVLAGNQPKIVSSGSVILENGKPCAVFDGVNDYLESQNGFNESIASFVSVYKNYQNANGRPFGVRASFVVNNKNTFAVTESNALVFDGAFLAGSIAATISQKITYAQKSTTNAKSYINGVENNNSSISLENTIGLFNIGNAHRDLGLEFNGSFQMGVFYPSDQSSNRAAIESNINSHYNIYAEDILEFNPYNIWDSEHITIDGTTTTLHDFNTFGDKIDMQNPTASNQPTYNAANANFNGLPSFTFDGVSQYVKADIVDYRNTDTSGVIVNVFRHLSGTFIFDLAISKSNTTNRYFITSINTNSYRPTLIPSIQRSFRGGTNIVTGSPSSVVAYADTGASYSMNINGNSETITMISGSNDGEAWFDGNQFNTISIGGVVLSSGVLFGNLEWCMSGYFPYTDESTTLEIVNFLKNKYGVA